jgi:hypothetical protein
MQGLTGVSAAIVPAVTTCHKAVNYPTCWLSLTRDTLIG